MRDSDSYTDLFFISHPDDVDFTRRLAAHLEIEDISCDISMAQSGGEASRQTLNEAVLRAHIVAVALSPASAASQLCNELIEFAVASGKRFLSIIIDEDIKVDVHPAIAQNPYIFFREDETVEDGVRRLLPYLELDDHRRLHTELLLRAHRWRASEDASHLLLPQERVDAAREWLSGGANREPKPSPLQVEYIHASRRQPPRKRRSTKPILVALALLLIAFSAIVIAREIESRQATAAAEIARRQARQASTQQVLSAAMTTTAESDAGARLLDRVAATSASLRDELLAELAIQARRATQSAAANATAAAEATAFEANARATETARLEADLAARVLLTAAERALDGGDADLALALAWEAAGKLREPAAALAVLQRAAALRPVIALDKIADIILHPSGKQIAALSTGRDRVSVYAGESGDRLYEIRKPDAALQTLAYSRDGGKLILGAEDGEIAVYESGDGAPRRKWQAHENQLHALALSRADDRLFSAGDAPRLAVWRMEDGQLATMLEAEDAATHQIEAMELTADDSHLLVFASGAGAPTISQYDANTLAEIEVDGDAPVYRELDKSGEIGFGYDSEERPTLWHASTGEEAARLGDGWTLTTAAEAGAQNPSDSLRFIGFADDRALLAIEDALGNRVVRLVNLSDGATVETFADDIGRIVTSAHALDDRVISATSDNRLILWSLDDGAQLREIGIASEPLTGVRVDASGVLTMGQTASGAAYVWRLDGVPVGMGRALPAAGFGTALSHDGSAVLMVEEDGLRLEASETGDGLLQLSDVQMARMNTIGTRFAVLSGETAGIYDAADGTRLASWRIDGAIDGMHLASSGDRLLVSHQSDTLQLLRVDGEPMTLDSLGLGAPLNVSFAEGDAFLSIHANGVAHWDGQSATPGAIYPVGLPADLLKRGAIDMALSPDGGALVFLAQLEGGMAALSQFMPGESDLRLTTFVNIAAAALSEGGARLALLQENGEVRVLDTATGEEAARFATELTGASQLQYHATLKRLYVASGATLLVYDVDSGAIFSRHEQGRPMAGFSTSADGRAALTQDSGGRFWLWLIESADDRLRRIETEVRPRTLTCAERETYLAPPLCD